jgi:two-component system response regulator FixJ
MNSKIFIIDDDRAVRESLRAVFDAYDFIVQAYSSGSDFLESAPLSENSVVILDLNLPGMDGMTVLRSLREERKSGLPVVVITGYATSKTHDQAIAAGANAFMLKPFDVSALIETVVHLAS